MSDIGGILTPLDLTLMLLVAASPGLVLGGLIGAYLSSRRLPGTLIGAGAGFVLCAAAWVIYLTVLK
ncbi:hypothetical protein DYI23_09680 [Roseibium polysiphoniae]|uniref:Uncharacterized protein n=1 Tax=Roseibium polysiphoniae TaxID=2571221 RepID=A0A944CBX5_9HYPH|nr:hypothetical protein [Roseibium polysiphoniae]MBS8260486.1 hypothetical protein [Roseibium polysiphoniae]